MSQLDRELVLAVQSVNASRPLPAAAELRDDRPGRWRRRRRKIGRDGGCRKTKDDTDRPQGLQPAHDSFLSRTLNSARPGSAGAARVPAARIDDQPNQVKRRLTLTVRRGSPARHDQAASASPETETARGGPRAARSVLPPLIFADDRRVVDRRRRRREQPAEAELDVVRVEVLDLERREGLAAEAVQ